MRRQSYNGHVQFKSAAGKSKFPQWPKTGTFNTAPKNDGVTAQVQQNEDAIGYVECG